MLHNHTQTVTWLTKIPIKENGFREQKCNISPLGQGIRLPLHFGFQVAVTVKLLGTCPPSRLTKGGHTVIVWFEV